MNTSKVIAEIDAQIRQLQEAREVLASLNGGSSTSAVRAGRRTMSVAARRRIAAAQRARWATVKAKNIVPIKPAKPKRVMSAASRRKSAAAQRARWAKVKAKNKKVA